MLRDNNKEWMKKNGIYTIKAWSTTDASDLPDGWSKPEEFKLNAIVVDNGENFLLYCNDEDVDYMPSSIRKRKLIVNPLEEFKNFYNALPEGNTLLGYGTEGWDWPLIFHNYNDTIPKISKRDDLKYIDLHDIWNVAEEELDVPYIKRRQVEALAHMNNARLTDIFYVNYLYSQVSLIKEWIRGRKGKVLDSVYFSTRITSVLAHKIYRKKGFKIRHPDTDKLVFIKHSLF